MNDPSFSAPLRPEFKGLMSPQETLFEHTSNFKPIFPAFSFSTHIDHNRQIDSNFSTPPSLHASDANFNVLGQDQIPTLNVTPKQSTTTSHPLQTTELHNSDPTRTLELKLMRLRIQLSASSTNLASSYNIARFHL